MVRAKVPTPQPAKMTVGDMERGVRRLQRRLDAVTAFDPATLDRDDPYATVRPLEADIETALTETFGHDSIEYGRFRAAASFDWPISMTGDIAHNRKIEYVIKERLQSIQLLTAAIDLLKERIEDADVAPPKDQIVSNPENSNRIFVVHGHDNEPKEAIARFLESLGYVPVILHEQPNKGRTIIQKFREEAADVGFAIVLMTPDDQMPDGTSRARQNVVLELGFFLGQLGPDRVAAIVKGKVQTPSDFDGVVYTSFDGGWKIALAKELAAAGYKVDWNAVMR